MMAYDPYKMIDIISNEARTMMSDHTNKTPATKLTDLIGSTVRIILLGWEFEHGRLELRPGSYIGRVAGVDGTVVFLTGCTRETESGPGRDVAFNTSSLYFNSIGPK
jgi:hypothetical protein